MSLDRSDLTSLIASSKIRVIALIASLLRNGVHLMSRTRHIGQRMSQRGITVQILELIEAFGIATGDKIILNQKGCTKVIAHLNNTIRQLSNICETGGYVLVEDNGKQITAYRLNSYKQP